MSDKQENEGEENKSINFKIITLGDSGVGKTSIIRRYVYNIFDDKNISTIGFTFGLKDINIKIFNIWKWVTNQRKEQKMIL